MGRWREAPEGLVVTRTRRPPGRSREACRGRQDSARLTRQRMRFKRHRNATLTSAVRNGTVVGCWHNGARNGRVARSTARLAARCLEKRAPPELGDRPLWLKWTRDGSPSSVEGAALE